MRKPPKNHMIGFQTRTKETYEDKISIKSNTARVNFDAAHKQFSKFTNSSFNESLEQVIEDLLQIKDAKEQRQKTFDVLQNFVNYLDSEGLAPSTNRVYFHVIKKYLKYRSFEIHTDDVRNEIDFPVIVEEKVYPLSNEDVSKLLFHANPDKKLLYLVLSSSAMRIEEALRLRKRDFIDKLERIMISIPGKYTKTKKARITFVSREAGKVLKPYLAKLKDDDIVFTENEDYLRAKNSAEKYFERVRKKAGFTEKKDTGTSLVTLHSFRYFFITRCNRIDFGLGNALAGHGFYMKKYDTATPEKLLEFYLEAEPSLLIDVEPIKEKGSDIELLREEVRDMKQMLLDKGDPPFGYIMVNENDVPIKYQDADSTEWKDYPEHLKPKKKLTELEK